MSSSGAHDITTGLPSQVQAGVTSDGSHQQSPADSQEHTSPGLLRLRVRQGDARISIAGIPRVDGSVRAVVETTEVSVDDDDSDWVTEDEEDDAASALGADNVGAGRGGLVAGIIRDNDSSPRRAESDERENENEGAAGEEPLPNTTTTVRMTRQEYEEALEHEAWANNPPSDSSDTSEARNLIEGMRDSYHLANPLPAFSDNGEQDDDDNDEEPRSDRELTTRQWEEDNNAPSDHDSDGWEATQAIESIRNANKRRRLN